MWLVKFFFGLKPLFVVVCLLGPNTATFCKYNGLLSSVIFFSPSPIILSGFSTKPHSMYIPYDNAHHSKNFARKQSQRLINTIFKGFEKDNHFRQPYQLIWSKTCSLGLHILFFRLVFKNDFPLDQTTMMEIRIESANTKTAIRPQHPLLSDFCVADSFVTNS